MTQEDIQTVARIVVNQNFAVLRARLDAVNALRKRKDLNDHVYAAAVFEQWVLEKQIENYQQSRVIQAKHNEELLGKR